ncbi:hypothetical protein [Methylobacter psychrophilus]|uniref:hypothetical protein n=1 Tax=Methylobacter psychrophilus TaxID=96941 RepID=UPI0021D4D32E|nr:hypothetical protein [Methylobacter psychrophilus]
MSKLHETKSDIVVLQRIPSHQGLMNVNRWLMAMVFFLMTVIVITGFFFLPANDLTRFKKAEVTVTEMNPVLSAEVNTLKGQFVGLVSGSIESKLRALEQSIQLGSVASSLGTIEDLKNDIKVLRSYSEPVKKLKATTIPNEQLMQEMSELKRLVYLTIASCGLMLAAVGGIWFKNRYRLPYKATIKHYLGKK